MLAHHCTTKQLIFDFLVGRLKTEDGSIIFIIFFLAYLKLLILLVKNIYRTLK